VSYYQFNETNGPALDKVGVRHGALAGPSIKRVKSTAPVGKGVSKSLGVAAGKKRYTFGQTGLTLVFPTAGTYPNGDVVVSRLFVSPDTLPATVANGSTDYWILHNFGSNTNFTAPSEVWFERVGDMPADLAANACKLWRREPVAHGPLWQSLDAADVLNEGAQAGLGFTSANQLKKAGQFWLELPGLWEQRHVAAPRTEDEAPVENVAFQVFPNPVAAGAALQLHAEGAGAVQFRLFDSRGNQVRSLSFEERAALPLETLPAGVYAYRLEGARHMWMGKVVVK
jgi:hypothetical protein